MYWIDSAERTGAITIKIKIKITITTPRGPVLHGCDFNFVDSPDTAMQSQQTRNESSIRLSITKPGIDRCHNTTQHKERPDETRRGRSHKALFAEPLPNHRDETEWNFACAITNIAGRWSRTRTRTDGRTDGTVCFLSSVRRGVSTVFRLVLYS